MELKTIAKIRTDFPAKFGLPRQSGIVENLSGTIVFETDYRNPDALRGLEGYSHVWLLWGFSENFASAKSRDDKDWSPTVRPPRLGGNRRVGVFSTRSPNRPNKIGLSCVRLLAIDYDGKDGPVLHVSGIDMMNDTPIYDIKPYLPYVDSHPDAVGGFAAEHIDDNLTVSFPDELLCRIPEKKRASLLKVLEQDPRPSYHHDETREYGFEFAGFEIKFTVSGTDARVHDVIRKQDI